MVVGDDSEDCSKVTVPPTLESPRSTATEKKVSHGMPGYHVEIYAVKRARGDVETGKKLRESC